MGCSSRLSTGKLASPSHVYIQHTCCAQELDTQPSEHEAAIKLLEAQAATAKNADDRKNLSSPNLRRNQHVHPIGYSCGGWDST